MTIHRAWHRAVFLIALSVLTAATMTFASSGKSDEPAQAFSYFLNPASNGWLGLVVKDTNEATAKELKLPHITGAIVVSVVAGSSAEKAGFKRDDVILGFDGQRVRSAAQLQRLIKETPVDRTVSIQISRQGKLQTLQAKVESRGPNALLETPENPNYKIWIGPEIEVPATPEQPEPFVEPVPKGKIIPLPEVMPKFYLGPIPNPEAQGLPHDGPFLEPPPKAEIIPLPPVMPKFKIGPIPNPEAQGLVH